MNNERIITEYQRRMAEIQSPALQDYHAVAVCMAEETGLPLAEIKAAVQRFYDGKEAA